MGCFGRRAYARRYKYFEPPALIGSHTSKVSERRHICNSGRKPGEKNPPPQNIIQNDKKGNSYLIRVTGTPETKAQEIYDLLEVKVSPNRVIRRLRNLDCST
ncbi:MAG: hypothetical protein PHY08_11430 [Candidatus Cloacimonetes bacterium]|nr:hypothetical protein [Candidatus Cloacimonadota bacterium]